MSRLFNIDNPFMQFLSRMFDLIVLNVVFILSCIPIITIGASLSALYSVTLKMVRGTDSYVIKGYFKAFAANFKQSTLMWLLFAALFFFLRFDYTIAASQNSGMFQTVRILLLMVILVLAAAFFYVFPIASHFVCTTKQLIRNSFLMSIGHLPYTAVLFVYCGVVIFLASRSTSLFGGVMGVSMICGFSVTAYFFSIIFSKIFKKYEPEESDEENNILE